MPRKKSTSKPETPLEQLSPLETGEAVSSEDEPSTGAPQPGEANPVTDEKASAEQAETRIPDPLPASDEFVPEAEMPDQPETAPQKGAESSDSSKESPVPDITPEDTGLMEEAVLDLTQQTADDSLWEEAEPGSLLDDELLQAEPLQVSEDLSSGLQEYLPAEQDDISDTVQVSKFGHPEEKASEMSAPAPRSKSAREEFFALNIKMGRKLSSKQQEEWENIYTSFRSRSALHGIISGKEIISLKVFNEAVGSNEIKDILCLTAVSYTHLLRQGGACYVPVI